MVSSSRFLPALHVSVRKSDPPVIIGTCDPAKSRALENEICQHRGL